MRVWTENQFEADHHIIL